MPVPVSFAIGDSRMSGEFAVRERDSGPQLAIVDGVSPALTEGVAVLDSSARRASREEFVARVDTRGALSPGKSRHDRTLHRCH